MLYCICVCMCVCVLTCLSCQITFNCQADYKMCWKWIKNICGVNHRNFTGPHAFTSSKDLRQCARLFHKLPWKPTLMPMTLELPNKELTPQMERHSGGRSGRRGKRMVWRRKGVAGAKVVSSRLWNQELLYALYSATPLHYRHRNAHTSTPAL